MWAQDRFGCRLTMMFFMAWLTIAIFIPFFAPSLSVLAFGEAMCGIAWGVFQVFLFDLNCLVFTLIIVDLVYLIRMRSRSYYPSPLCHRLRVHVLGRRHPAILWSH